MKILAAPAHYVLSDFVGSEPYIAFKIITSIALSDTSMEMTAICGYSLVEKANIRNIPSNLKIIPLYEGSPKFSDFSKLKFYLDLYNCVKRRDLARNVDVIHHILPFGYEATFNFLFKLAKKYKHPFIVGPVQSPHIFVYSDEFVGEKFTAWKPIMLSNIALVRFFSRPLLRKLFTNTVQNASLIIANTRFAKKLYEQYVDSGKIIVIPFGIDVGEVRVKDYGRASDKVSLMFTGSLTMRKGIHYLLRAFVMVLRKYKDTELHIYGKGPQESYLRNLARSLRISDKVFFHGFIPRSKLLKEYNKHDIYVHTSLSESFGLSMVEAMAAGLPVVAFNIPNVNEIVVHGKTGFLVKLGSVKDLAEVLSILIEDEELRRGVGRNARERALRQYDWNVIAQKYVRAYEEALKHA